MARIMLIGDSIRNSYEPLVAEILGAEGHEVWGAPGNSQFTLFTLASLGSWLTAFPEPDVVHWNNGLHDIGHNPNRAPVQMPLEVYSGNLRFIGRHLCSPPRLASSLPAIHRCTRAAHSATISGPGAMRRSTPTMTPLDW